MILEEGREIKGLCEGKTRRWPFAWFLAFCGSFLFITAPLRADERPVLRVGILLSLSGGLEQWCGYMRQGVELAAREYKGSGIEIIIEDDHSVDKKTSVTAAHKLIDQSSIHVLFSWTLSNTAALTPIVKRARIPLVVGAFDNRISLAGDYVFGAVVNNDLTPREIARFFKARGAQHVALVLATDDWSASFDAPFRDEATRLGLDIVYSESISPTETETRSIIANLKLHKVDGVIAPLFGNSLVSFIRRHREMKASSIINVGDGMFESDIKTIGDAAEGVTASQIWLDSPELKEKVRAHFGLTHDPLQLGLVASGYDSIAHIVKAANEIRSRGLPVSGETLNRILKTFRSVGYLGEHMLGAPPTRAGEQITVVEKGRYMLAEYNLK